MQSKCVIVKLLFETKSSVNTRTVANYLIHMNSDGELWLLRHGETKWTLSGAHTSYTDLPLTEEGERCAKALGTWLKGRKFALTLSSPMRRALETGRLAGYSPQLSED